MIPGTATIGLITDGNCRFTFLASLLELTLHDLAHEHRLFTHDRYWLPGIYGSGGIVQGRNDVARSFLDETEAEWLLWLDTDMGFDPDLLERLIAVADPVDRPIVGALCFALKKNGDKAHRGRRFVTIPTIYRFVQNDTEAGWLPQIKFERDALVECDGTGSAAILVHRSVLAAIRDEFGDDWYTPIQHKLGNVFSEDLSFCARARGCGFKIHVDTATGTTHDKGGLYLDIEQFDFEQTRFTRGTTDAQ